MPNVLPEILYFIENKQSVENISNIIQTSFWKDKLKSFKNNDIVLPFFLYYDDYESGNPLSSHAGIHKLGAVYSSIPCMPVRFQSSLENIFLTLLFHTMDLKEFGSSAIFNKLVEECNYLQKSGIEVVSSGKKIKVYFVLTLLLGDNLGLNKLLGFTESFRSNHYCRFCKCARVDMEHQVNEDQTMLRNRTNYAADIQLNNLKVTGIKELCVWNKVQLFHVCENYSVDIAHDIFEGIALFDMTELLYQFIFIDKIFTVDHLNSRIKYFNFGNSNINKPPLLSLENLEKKKINMSCAEMKAFVQYVGIMLEDVIPVGNRYWKLYTLLRKILKIVLSDSINMNPSICNLLSNIISKHHTLYKDLFSLPLKPKHHNLTHYPGIISKIGPLIYLSSLKYESKHKQSKTSANVVTCRRNITRTLAIKHQLNLSKKFFSKTSLSDALVDKNKVPFDPFQSIAHFKTILSSSKISFDVFQEYPLFSAKKVTYNNKVYRIKDVIPIDIDFYVFGIITHILVNKSDEICFVYKELETYLFDLHSFSCVIKETNIMKCIFDTAVPYVAHLCINTTKSNEKLITFF
ncbi:hypothetical protein PPYR_00141 [Photinus pyralis]|uniref:Uncharacterized protein n=1 Tax=Photinus pyralis TaxID=7054 RepID=A0A5N4B0P1_PHOPY|nr:hypothetical protein PPYR_00141 [Photinus pyralis]